MILLAGLQGSGKTTAAAKLARLLKSKGKRPLLVAADLQRPAAIDQLESLLAVDAPLSVRWLSADPTWDPLRDEPRFQRLLEGEG